MRPRELHRKRSGQAAKRRIQPRVSPDPKRKNLMRNRPQFAAQPAAIDLARVDEATRRALYDAVVAVHFYPSLEEVQAASRKGEWYQRYTPDECRVNVLHLFGRWFVAWRIWDLEEGAPERQQWVLMTIRPNARRPFGIEFYEA